MLVLADVVLDFPVAPDAPVTGVCAADVADFAEWLTAVLDDGWTYRLPTAAEAENPVLDLVLDKGRFAFWDWRLELHGAQASLSVDDVESEILHDVQLLLEQRYPLISMTPHSALVEYPNVEPRDLSTAVALFLLANPIDPVAVRQAGDVLSSYNPKSNPRFRRIPLIEPGRRGDPVAKFVGRSFDKNLLMNRLIAVRGTYYREPREITNVPIRLLGEALDRKRPIGRGDLLRARLALLAAMSPHLGNINVWRDRASNAFNAIADLVALQRRIDGHQTTTETIVLIRS